MKIFAPLVTQGEYDMADSKTQYTTNVNKMKKVAESNEVLAGKLAKGKERASKYSSGWDSVNLNEVVQRFAPDSTIRESNGKIIYSNGGRYEVVADVAGGYLRVQDVNIGKLTYVTLSGEYKPNNISKSKWKQMTHYRIKKLEEM